MTVSRAALACLVALITAGGSALGQQPPPERAAAFTKIEADIRDTSPGDDYSLTSGQVDLLEKGEVAGFELEVAVDTDYAIIGACDSECFEIGLAVFNEKGELIDVDRSGDSPIVLIPASKGGTLTVRIEMVDCDESPCAFGVGIFEKGAEDPDKAKRIYDAAKQLFQ